MNWKVIGGSAAGALVGLIAVARLFSGPERDPVDQPVPGSNGPVPQATAAARATAAAQRSVNAGPRTQPGTQPGVPALTGPQLQNSGKLQTGPALPNARTAPGTDVPSSTQTNTQTTRPATPALTGPIETETFSLTVPASGWTVVAETDNTAVLRSTQYNGGLIVESDVLFEQSMTLDRLVQSRVDELKRTFRDATYCPGREPQRVGNETTFMLCYTIQPQNGPAYKQIDSYRVRIQDDDVYTIVNVFGAESQWSSILSAVNPVIRSISWDLL